MANDGASVSSPTRLSQARQELSAAHIDVWKFSNRAPVRYGFTYFLLLSIPFLSTRIVPLHFQAGGRRKRPNLCFSL